MREIDDELNTEIHAFIRKIESMNNADSIDALKMLFIKHLQLKESEHLIGKYELNMIRSKAIQNYVDYSTEIFLEDKKLTPQEVNLMHAVEATIGELRRCGALKKLVKFKK